MGSTADTALFTRTQRSTQTRNNWKVASSHLVRPSKAINPTQMEKQGTILGRFFLRVRRSSDSVASKGLGWVKHCFSYKQYLKRRSETLAISDTMKSDIAEYSAVIAELEEAIEEIKQAERDVKQARADLQRTRSSGIQAVRPFFEMFPELKVLASQPPGVAMTFSDIKKVTNSASTNTLKKLGIYGVVHVNRTQTPYTYKINKIPD